MGPYVLLYQNVVCGYHPNQDSDDAWHELQKIVTSAAPQVNWNITPSFRLCYDNQFSKPFGETCHSSLGWVICANQHCGHPEETVAAWRSLFHNKQVRIDYMPRGECLAVFFQYKGVMSHYIAVGRLLLWSWCRLNTAFVLPTSPSSSSPCATNATKEDEIVIDECAYAASQKVPGIMQICDPASRTLSFLLPLEERKTMLPFELKHACRPWKI